MSIGSRSAASDRRVLVTSLANTQEKMSSRRRPQHTSPTGTRKRRLAPNSFASRPPRSPVSEKLTQRLTASTIYIRNTAPPVATSERTSSLPARCIGALGSSEDVAPVTHGATTHVGRQAFRLTECHTAVHHTGLHTHWVNPVWAQAFYLKSTGHRAPIRHTALVFNAALTSSRMQSPCPLLGTLVPITEVYFHPIGVKTKLRRHLGATIMPGVQYCPS